MGKVTYHDADVIQQKKDKEKQQENVIVQDEIGRQTPFPEYVPEFDYDPYEGQLEYIQSVIPETPAMKPKERSKFPVINFDAYSDKLRPDGTYEYVSYTNKNGVIEFIFNVDKAQAEAEVKHRTYITNETGAKNYRLDLDHTRVKGYYEGRPDIRAKSTADEKYRLTTVGEGLITGRPGAKLKIFGENFGSVHYDPVGTDLTGRAFRTFLGTTNLAFGSGNWLGREMVEGLKYIDEVATGPDADPNYSWEVPTKEDIDRMIEKPDASALTQFLEIIAPGIGQTALLVKGLGTFKAGAKHYETAMQNALKNMKAEGRYVNYEKLEGLDKVTAKRELIARARRDFIKSLDDTANYNFVQRTIPFGKKLTKMVRIGRYDAHVNPKAWLAGEGLAEVGIAGSMVLSHQYLSNKEDDTFAIYGAANTGIGVIGAFAMQPLASTGTLIGATKFAKGMGYKIKQIIGIEDEDFLGGYDALKALSTNNREYLETLPLKQRKIALQMVDDIYNIDDIAVREEIIDNAKHSFAIIEDLRALGKQKYAGDLIKQKNWNDRISVSMGQLFQVSNLMAAEEYLIRTAREGKTVAFNAISATARIQTKRVQAQRALEGMLEEYDSFGSGVKIDDNTRSFLEAIRTGADELSTENKGKQVILENLMDMAVDKELVKRGIDPTYTKKDQAILDELFEANEQLIEAMAETGAESARVKKAKLAELYSKVEAANSLLSQKHLSIMKDFGVEDVSELHKSTVSMIHNRGEILRKAGSKRYEKAKKLLGQFSITGKDAETHIQESYRALRLDDLDKIIGRTEGATVREAVNNAYREVADDVLDQFIEAVDPDPAQYDTIKRNIMKKLGQDEEATNPLALLNTLIQIKNGKAMAGIDKEVLDNIEIELDVLNQYGIGQVINREISNISGRLKTNTEGLNRLKMSKLTELSNKHNELTKRFEEYAPKNADEAGSEAWQNLTNAKKYWKEVVVPATYNNPLWYNIKTTEDAGLNFEKASTYLENQLKDPYEFVRNAERLFGTWDEVAGKHVIKSGSQEHKELQGMLNSFYGHKISEEAKRIQKTTKPIEFTDDTWNQFELDEDAISNIKAGTLGFTSEGFNSTLINNIEEVNKAFKGTAIDLSSSLYRPRQFTTMLQESEQVRKAVASAGNEMERAGKGIKAEVARIKEAENIFSKRMQELSGIAGEISSPKDFVQKFLIPGGGAKLRDLETLLVKKGNMEKETFDTIVKRQIASGLRQMSEGSEPIKEVAVKTGKPLSDPQIGEIVDRVELKGGQVEARMIRRVNGAELLMNIQQNKGILEEFLGKEHTAHMEIVAAGIEIMQRKSKDYDSPELIKASRMTIGSMLSRTYAVFSGRVSWRYVGAEALFLQMAKNEAAAVTAILADENATKAIAYIVSTGQPVTDKIKTANKFSAWLPNVAMLAQDESIAKYDRMYEKTEQVREYKKQVGRQKVLQTEDQMSEIFN